VSEIQTLEISIVFLENSRIILHGYMYSMYGWPARTAMVHKALLKIYARGVVSYFYFSRAPRARAENKANQQCHFKSSRCRMDPLGTDSCRGTGPMGPPMSKGSMRHQNPDLDFDDPGPCLQGALCTITARIFVIESRFFIEIIPPVPY
jgi:hypothetical protein